MAEATNLHYFVGRSQKLIPGLELNPWLDKKTNAKSLVTILGQTVGGRPARDRPFRVIPLAKTRPGVNEEITRALSGSFIKEPAKRDDGTEYEQTVLTAYKKDGVWYAITRTGLFVDERGDTNADLNRLIFNGVDVKPHGSFSLDGQSVKVESAKGLELASTEATRLRFAVQKSSVPLLGSPEYRHDLWSIPVGASVLIQDIDGTLVRLVGEKDRLLVADAKGYGKVFEDLEMRRREERKRERELRQAAKANPGTPAAGNTPAGKTEVAASTGANASAKPGGLFRK